MNQAQSSFLCVSHAHPSFHITLLYNTVIMASPQRFVKGKRRDKVFKKPYKPAGKMCAETKRMFAQWPGQKWAGSKWAVFMNPGGLLHLCCMRCKRKERHSRGQPFPKMIVILLYRCSPAARFCAGKRKPLPAPCAFKASQPGTARPPPAGSVRAKVRRKGPVRRHSLPLRYTRNACAHNAPECPAPALARRPAQGE